MREDQFLILLMAFEGDGEEGLKTNLERELVKGVSLNGVDGKRVVAVDGGETGGNCEMHQRVVQEVDSKSEHEKIVGINRRQRCLGHRIKNFSCCGSLPLIPLIPLRAIATMKHSISPLLTWDMLTHRCKQSA